MLSVVKPRLIACAIILSFTAVSSLAIGADETQAPIANFAPATNRASGGTINRSDASTIVIALANSDTGSSHSHSSPSTIPPTGSRPWPTPAHFFTINQVLAKRQNNASPLEFASVPPTETDADRAAVIPPTQGDEPFGLYAFRAPEGTLSGKWRKLQADIQSEAPVLRKCRIDASACSPATARFVAIIKEAAALTHRAKLRLVNERVNSEIRYTEDWAQWHQADVWSAPLDVAHRGSFDTGMGDCEDYAIAKYVALKESGVSMKDLRILLVKDEAVHLDHAVLAVRDENNWLILDNRWSRLVDDTEMRQFVPLYALNDEGLKLFAAPYAMSSVMPLRSPSSAGPKGYFDAGLSRPSRMSLGAFGELALVM